MVAMRLHLSESESGLVAVAGLLKSARGGNALGSSQDCTVKAGVPLGLLLISWLREEPHARDRLPQDLHP